MAKGKKKIAVIGSGNWGKNLVRNFAQLGVLEAVCDTNEKLLKSIQDQYKVPHAFSHYQDLLNTPAIDAVVVASPAASHYPIVKAALQAEKDVFVEKPLALKIEEAEELLKTNAAQKRILMVDHLLQYHPAVIKLKEMLDAGALGKLRYIYSNRLNIGRLRNEENILWSFAPHDISVILYLTERQPQHVSAFGEAYLQDHIYDTTITHLAFSDRLKAHIYVSWLHPFKEQKLVVVGDKAMAVFDDLEEKDKLVVYSHKIDWLKQIPVASKATKEVITIDPKEPLREACQHFLECIEHRTNPKTDGHEALAVLKILHQAEQGLKQGKGP